MEGKERAVLRQYLLGALSEVERFRLADRYFVDEEFFDELLDVENDLLDRYVRGRLSPEERQNFGKYLTAHPDGAGKLAAAHALMDAARGSREILPGQLAATASTSTSRWTPLGGLLGRGPVWQFAMVAILFASLAGVGYLIVTQRRSPSAIEQFPAARTQAEEEKANLGQQTRTAEREQSVEQEQIRQLHAELDLARSKDRQKTTPQTTGGVVASLVLTPALRSGGAPDLLRVTRATRTLLLVIPVANEEEIPSYRLVLQTTTGRLVFTWDRLRPQSQQQRRTISCRLAAARLTGGNYKLTLIGRSADGVEIAQDFYFNVASR
jgi:hypothetical protein